MKKILKTISLAIIILISNKVIAEGCRNANNTIQCDYAEEAIEPLTNIVVNKESNYMAYVYERYQAKNVRNAKTEEMPYYLKRESINLKAKFTYNVPKGTSKEIRKIESDPGNNIISALAIAPNEGTISGILDSKTEGIALTIIGGLAAYGLAFDKELYLYRLKNDTGTKIVYGEITKPITEEIVKELKENSEIADTVVQGTDLTPANNEAQAQYCQPTKKVRIFNEMFGGFDETFTDYICSDIYSDAVVDYGKKTTIGKIITFGYGTYKNTSTLRKKCAGIISDKTTPIDQTTYTIKGEKTVEDTIEEMENFCPTRTIGEPQKPVLNEHGHYKYNPETGETITENIPYTKVIPKTIWQKQETIEGIKTTLKILRVVLKEEEKKNVGIQIVIDIEGLTLGGANIKIRYIKTEDKTKNKINKESISYSVDKPPISLSLKNPNTGSEVTTPAGVTEIYTLDGSGIEIDEGSSNNNEENSNEEETQEWECGVDGKPGCITKSEKVELEDTSYGVNDLSQYFQIPLGDTENIIPKHQSECPVIKVDLRGVFAAGLLNNIYTIESHCTLIDKHSDLIKLVMYIGWLIISFSIVLSA